MITTTRNNNISLQQILLIVLCILYVTNIIGERNGVDAFQYTDLTRYDQKNMYADYNTLQCHSDMIFLFEDPAGIVSADVPNSQIVSFLQVLDQSPTKMLYNARIETFHTNTQFEIIVVTDITVNITHTVNVDFICQVPPTLDIEFIGNDVIQVQPSFILHSPYYFLFRIKNLDKPLTSPGIRVTSPFYGAETYAVTKDIYICILPFKDGIETILYLNSTFQFQTYGGTQDINKQIGSLSLNYDNTEKEACNFSLYPRISDSTTPQTLSYPEGFMISECSYNENKRAFSTFRLRVGYEYAILVQGNFTNPTYFKRFQISETDLDPLYASSIDFVKTAAVTNQINIQYQRAPKPLFSLISFGLTSNNEIALVIGDTNATYQGDKYTINTIDIFLPYPFGYSQGNSLAYRKKSEFYIDGDSIERVLFKDFSVNNYLVGPGHLDLPPSIVSIESIKIPNSPWLLIKMRIQAGNSGFNSFMGFGNYTNIISGDGVYEFVVLESSGSSLLSNYGGLYIYDSLRFLNIYYTLAGNPINVDAQEFNFKLLNLSQITNMRFERNDIDVTNKSQDTILYIYTTQVDKDYWPTIVTGSFGKSLDEFTATSGSWNESCECYSFPITVPMNYPTGDYELFIALENVYATQTQNLLFKGMFGPDAALRVYSEQGDLLGPIVTNVELLPSSSVTVQQDVDTTITFRLSIQDKYNGFKSGLVSFVSSLDLVRYNFTITPDKMVSGGDIYNGVYEFTITVNGKCKSQTFYLQFIELVDRAGYVSLHTEGGNYPGTYRTYLPNYPFRFNRDIKELSSITVDCQNSLTDSTAPVLTLFDFTPKSIDVMDSGEFFNTSRQVLFTFTTSDQNGILFKSTPRIYISDQRLNIIHQDSILKTILPTTATYECLFTIPYGFGYGSNLKVSIFGIVDNQSNFNGYSITQLSDDGFPNTITVTPTSMPMKRIILSTKVVYSNGDIIVVGKGFTSTDSLLVDFKNGTISTLSNSIFNSDSVIVFNNPNQILVSSIIITVSGTDGKYSNSFNVPIIFKELIVVDSSSSIGSSSSSSSGSNETPEPNKPQTCNNNCGGSDHGVCTPNGCVCKSPWIGLDCLSQVIVIDPVINTTTPSTNITVPTNDKNTAIYYAIISVVALNELDKDKQLFKQHQFPQWIVNNNTISKYSQYTNSSYLYSSSFDYNNITTNINVSIDYFNVNTPVNITFASQIFTMNPYSLKYSVNISEYSFSSSLNTLQLVLLASIETKDNSDECSSKQFGDTVESDSEYIKMQVNDHSLYGRFIKRGVVDGRIKTVTNTQLDNQYNSISTQSQIQSYIGINIPFYKKSVELDPDFSVLVDNRPASNNDNAICGGSKISKLSTAQLAGIIVGSVLFGAIVIVAIVYGIYKTRQQTTFRNSFNQKLSQAS